MGNGTSISLALLPKEEDLYSLLEFADLFSDLSE